MGKFKKIAWTLGVVIAILTSIFVYSALGRGSSILGILFLVAGISVVALCGIMLYQRFGKDSRSNTVMNSSTVVDSLKRVFKVVTAEGHFTEIVDFKNTKQAWSIMPSTKKALIIIKAKVEMGYDFSKIEWDINEKDGTVKLVKMPDPQITSIHPDINYYNLENGIFNKFTNEDFNAIQAQCLDQVKKVALESDLPHVAADQAKLLISELAKMHSWHLEGIQLLD